MYLAFGMPVAMLGVAWPTLRDDLGRADGDLGVLVLAYGLGRLVTSASSGPLLARLRFGLASALTLVGPGAQRAVGGHVAVVGRPWSRPWRVVGVLSGVLDSLGARFLAVSGSVRRAGLAAGSYGVGATVGPVVIAAHGLGGRRLPHRRRRGPGRPRRWWWRPASTGPPGLDSPPAGDPAERPPSRSAWPICCAPRRCSSRWACSPPSSPSRSPPGGWLATVLEDARGVDDRLAGLSVGGFWAGITIGRLLLGRFDLPDRALLVGVGRHVDLLRRPGVRPRRTDPPAGGRRRAGRGSPVPHPAGPHRDPGRRGAGRSGLGLPAHRRQPGARPVSPP